VFRLLQMELNRGKMVQSVPLRQNGAYVCVGGVVFQVWWSWCFKCGGVGVSSASSLGQGVPVFQVRDLALCFRCFPVFQVCCSVCCQRYLAAASRDIYIEMRVAVCLELGASLLRSDLSSGFSLRFSAPHIKGFRVQGLEFVDHVASTATPHRDARQVD
jgi:hypothetical protein